MLTAQEATELALKYHQAGRLRKAYALYQQILKIQPRNHDVLHWCGLVSHGLGDQDMAYAFIHKAISLNPTAAHFHNNLGEVCRTMNRLDEAVSSFERALSLQPEFPEARRNIGLTYLAKEQPDLAIAYLREALTLYPNHPGICWALGQALMHQHQFDDAINIYSLGLEKASQDPTLICSKGVALQASGELEKTIQHYLDAIALQPAISEFHVNLALAYQEQNNYPEAINCLQRTLEINPNNVTVKHTLAAFQNITPDHAPATYVQKLFDDYAENFDKHLVGKLGYDAHAEIAAMLRPQFAVKPHTFNILDMGCGTGLFGEQIKDVKKKLVGIDLSPRMIRKAELRKIYDQLITGDLLDYLKEVKTGEFDLIAATDVFNYVGNLLPVFIHASRILTPGGWFTFSIEAAPDGSGDFILDKTGRYLHHKDYLAKLEAQFGLLQISLVETCLRKENDKPVKGYLYLLRKADH